MRRVACSIAVTADRGVERDDDRVVVVVWG
jgi:hypothetical protein